MRTVFLFAALAVTPAIAAPLTDAPVKPMTANLEQDNAPAAAAPSEASKTDAEKPSPEVIRPIETTPDLCLTGRCATV